MDSGLDLVHATVVVMHTVCALPALRWMLLLRSEWIRKKTNRVQVLRSDQYRFTHLFTHHPRIHPSDTSREDVGIILVVRRDATKKTYAIPGQLSSLFTHSVLTFLWNAGGFVNVGETVENAVLREVHEVHAWVQLSSQSTSVLDMTCDTYILFWQETNLVLEENALSQFKTVSDPKRDYRRHTVSVVFRCIAEGGVRIDEATGGELSCIVYCRGMTWLMTYWFVYWPGGQKHLLRGGDDAKSVEVMSLKRLLDKNLSVELAFDHRSILETYAQEYHPGLLNSV